MRLSVSLSHAEFESKRGWSFYNFDPFVILTVLRILQINSARSIGGGERHFVDLAAELDRRGHTVFVAIAPRSPIIKLLPASFRPRVFQVKMSNALDVRGVLALRRIVRECDADVVHAHLARDYSLAAGCLINDSHKGLIITRHLLFPLSKFQKVIFKRVNHAVAVSDAVAASLRAQKILPDDKISVVPNGLCVDKFADARGSVSARLMRERLKLGDAPVIGIIGELSRIKGQDVFLRAASLVSRVRPDVRFLIVGDDNSYSHRFSRYLKELAAQLKLETRGEFHPSIEDIENLYPNLAAIVSCSVTESFGLVIAEAMAGGNVVIATKTEGASELIQDEVSGILVNINDEQGMANAILRVVEDGSFHRVLGSNANGRIRAHFGIDKMVTRLEEIYLAST